MMVPGVCHMDSEKRDCTEVQITPRYVSDVKSKEGGRQGLLFWFTVVDVVGNSYVCFNPYLLRAFAEGTPTQILVEDTGGFNTIRDVVGFGGDHYDWEEKAPKNEAEASLYKLMRSSGWEVTKRGWPDFACFKDGKMILVEVKPKRSHRLKFWQRRLMRELAEKGVECYRWSPDDGFVRIQGGLASLEEANGVI